MNGVRGSTTVEHMVRRSANALSLHKVIVSGTAVMLIAFPSTASAASVSTSQQNDSAASSVTAVSSPPHQTTPKTGTTTLTKTGVTTPATPQKDASPPVRPPASQAANTQQQATPEDTHTNHSLTTKQTNATGPAKPTGAGSGTYHFNTKTGLWENKYYTWNPDTHRTTPRVPPAYSYNPSTGMWDTTMYQYDPASNKYVPKNISVATPPAQSAGAPATIESTGTTAPVQPHPSSPQQDSTTSAYDGFYNAAISNTINSLSDTGNAATAHNTSAGNTSTGNAFAEANVLNLLQSSTNMNPSSNVVTFVSNIQGDVTGNILVDPSQIAHLQTKTSATPATRLTVNTKSSGTIDNTVSVAAQSGTASVDGNTSAGNAQTGSADAVANIMNVINSTIGSGKSFIGTINIYGNLSGNILMPKNFLNSLIASNVPSTTIDSAQLPNIHQINTKLSNNAGIGNTVTTTAQSGAASVDGNTSAGTVRTGNANTNITVFNLTGEQVVGKNALLVFVNVLGKWVGVIMNAPHGATAAELGGGLTTNAAMPLSTGVTNTANQSSIRNTIAAHATSGDASVHNNTIAGNATSGDASASANILNMINNQVSLANWFGVLFINVFGSWSGNFGVDSIASAPQTGALSPTQVEGTGSMPTPSLGSNVFTFSPTNVNHQPTQVYHHPTNPTTSSVITTYSNGQPTTYAQFIPYTRAVPETNRVVTYKANEPPVGHGNITLPVIGSLLGTTLVGIDQRKRLAKLWSSHKR